MFNKLKTKMEQSILTIVLKRIFSKNPKAEAEFQKYGIAVLGLIVLLFGATKVLHIPADYVYYIQTACKYSCILIVTAMGLVQASGTTDTSLISPEVKQKIMDEGKVIESIKIQEPSKN